MWPHDPGGVAEAHGAVCSVNERFVTPLGDEMEAVSSDAMREIDRIAVTETGPSLLQMMENAGRSMAVLALRRAPVPHEECRVLVMSGRGGNGGGGISCARHLARRVRLVDLCLVGSGRPSAAVEAQLVTYRASPGGEVDMEALVGAGPYDVIVDAVIGYGLRDAPSGEAVRAIAWMNAASAVVLSLDLPSGLHPESGQAPGACVAPEMTLTLHLPKPGLLNLVAGDLCVADLGIPDAVTRRVGVAPPRYGPAFATPLLRV